MSIQAPEAPAAPPAEPAAPSAAAPVPQAPPVPAPPATAPPAVAVPPQPAAPAQPPATQESPETDWKAQAEAAQVSIAAAKAEADRWKAQSRVQEQRSKANHAELKNRDAVLRQIAEKVGIEFDDRPDPEELTRKLDEAQTVARQRTVELAVYTTAAQAGGNASALLDSREFMSRTAALDPDAADFPSQVADLVREAARQPKYSAPTPDPLTPQVTQQPAQQQPAAQFQQPPAPAAPPASSSGADFSGAPGGNRLWTQADLDAAIARDRDGTIVSKAIEDGLLVNLGVGKPRTKNRR